MASRPLLKEFADRIMDILPVVFREFAKHQIGGFYKLKITMPQFITLELLERLGVSKMTHLARSLNVTTAAMTGTVDRLVRDGYVKRASDPKDRRIVRISLTGKGSRTVREITERRRGMILHIFGKVSERDRADYLRVLTNIRDILLKEKRGE